MKDNSQRYSRWIVGMHWLTAVLVVTAYLTSEGSKHLHGKAPFIHVIVGLAVLTLTVPRLVMRFVGRIPPYTNARDLWIVRLAGAGHATIYLLLLVVPITGWFTLSRLGLSVRLLGFQLPLLTAPVADAPGIIANVHQIGGNLLLVIAALHAAFGFWHFFWLRDATLQRMLPR